MANQLFNVETNVSNEAAPSAQPTTSMGVITAQQSAITFAGVPALVTAVCAVLGSLTPSLSNSKLLAIGLSVGLGMLIYWQSAPVGGSKKDKIIGFVLALINSLAIAGTALGFSSAVTQPPAS